LAYTENTLKNNTLKVSDVKMCVVKMFPLFCLCWCKYFLFEKPFGVKTYGLKTWMVEGLFGSKS